MLADRRGVLLAVFAARGHDDEIVPRPQNRRAAAALPAATRSELGVAGAPLRVLHGLVHRDQLDPPRPPDRYHRLAATGRDHRVTGISTRRLRTCGFGDFHITRGMPLASRLANSHRFSARTSRDLPALAASRPLRPAPRASPESYLERARLELAHRTAGLPRRRERSAGFARQHLRDQLVDTRGQVRPPRTVHASRQIVGQSLPQHRDLVSTGTELRPVSISSTRRRASTDRYAVSMACRIAAPSTCSRSLPLGIGCLPPPEVPRVRPALRRRRRRHLM